MAIGGILIIAGILVWLLLEAPILGIILIVVGLLLGGFRRGSWY